MRLIVDLIPSDPRFGLALDEALFESVVRGGDGILRVWIDRLAVIVGRSQSLAAEVDLAQARREGIRVLRRISGGGTVVHYRGNLNVSAIAATGAVGSVAAAFSRLGAAIVDGLSTLGLLADVSGNRLSICGRKIGGAAQARRGAAVLYHSTVLVFPPERPIESLLLAHRPGYRPVGVASRPESMTTLSEVLGRSVAVGEAASAIVSGLASAFRCDEAAVSVDEAARAAGLAEKKYGSWQWNASR